MNRRYLAVAALLAVVVVVLSAVALIAATRFASPNSSGLSTFTSYGDMARYLGGSRPSGGYRQGGADSGMGPGTAAMGGGGGGYSGTNVQVAGVDEMDLVKTDGTYVYVASWSNVSVIRADPPTAMAVVSKIPAADLGIDHTANESVWIAGLYVDGPRLYVVSVVYTISREPSPMNPGVMDVWWYPMSVWTAVSVVDLSQVDNPVRTRFVAVSGYPLASRMVDGTVYVVAQEWIYFVDQTYVGPELCEGTACAGVPATSIWYDPGVRDAGSFTNLLAVDGRAAGHGLLSVVTSYASTLYMSPGALYLTFYKWDDSGSSWWARTVTYWTSIYKIRADGTALQVVAQGDVDGSLWSQFAMDEQDGHLRVVTQGNEGTGANVYVLDAGLARVGALEGLAPGEQVFATRFVGNTLYLVTFRRVDPFFVIDLSNPAKPAVLGELTIPGFSTYLHPVDADHVLGVGTENGTVKVSLYDVSDPMHPVESSKFTVGGYSWSIAQYEHKAFLFDRTKELLVIPVDRWDEGYRTTESGAYVFRASVDAGLTLRGVVSHGNSSYYGGVQRSLYIGDALYTVSNTTLKAIALSDLSELGSLAFETFP